MVGIVESHDFPNEERSKMNISMAGCGFLGIYHVGVASCIKEYAPELYADKIAGASAGALVSCALLCGCTLGDCTTYTLSVSLQARARALGPLHPSFNMIEHLRGGLDKFLPDNAHEICTGHLHISLTRLSDRQNVIVTQFDSKQDLIQALVCSCFIPLYCGIIPPKYKGVRYIDGGISDNLPILDSGTITVSPFAGESDICPHDNSPSFLSMHIAGTSIQLNSENMYRASHAFFPPKPEVLGEICKKGFDDALKFLQRNNLISCIQHLRVESAITSANAVNHEEMADNAAAHSSAALTQDPHEVRPQYYFDNRQLREGSRGEDQVEGSGSSGSTIDSESDDGYHDDEGMENTPSHSHHTEYVQTCAKCQEIQALAVINSLPTQVVTAVQVACDSVNKTPLAPVYNLRAFKVLSLMSAPWLLPIDVAVILGHKAYEWAPYLSSDLQWFVGELYQILQEFYSTVQDQRHRLSARFSCQLAITETDYLSGQRSRHSSRTQVSHSQLHSQLLSDATAIFPRRRKSDLKFSVDFSSISGSAIGMGSPAESIAEIVSPEDLQDEEMPVQPVGRTSRRQSTSAIKLDDLANYDTFDNYLHISNQMDAILSFYYAEEDDPNTIKVMEIFPLDDPSGPSPTFDTSLVWDNYMEMKSETETLNAQGHSRLRRSMSEVATSSMFQDALETDDFWAENNVDENLLRSDSNESVVASTSQAAV